MKRSHSPCHANVAKLKLTDRGAQEGHGRPTLTVPFAPHRDAGSTAEHVANRRKHVKSQEEQNDVPAKVAPPDAATRLTHRHVHIVIDARQYTAVAVAGVVPCFQKAAAPAERHPASTLLRIDTFVSASAATEASTK